MFKNMNYRRKFLIVFLISFIVQSFNYVPASIISLPANIEKSNKNYINDYVIDKDIIKESKVDFDVSENFDVDDIESYIDGIDDIFSINNYHEYNIAKSGFKSKSSRSSRIKSKSNRTKKMRRSTRSRSAAKYDELKKALILAKRKRYLEASKLLYILSKSSRFRRERMQIKYILGLMLFEMRLYHTASQYFIDVLKEGKSKYIRKSLERLALIADFLGDDSLLNYAMSKIEVSKFPSSQWDMLNFRIGESKYYRNDFKSASRYFSYVKPSSRYFYRAKYKQGLSYVEMGDLRRAVSVFDSLYEERQGAKVNDKIKMIALISKARIYYQNNDWLGAIKFYRDIPKDTQYWHDALFESSWAYLRAYKFRSALSNFSSLHSSYYDFNYNPESLLLRAIVYLYICKYDEMEKVLTLFKNKYTPIKNKVDDFLGSRSKRIDYYNEISKSVLGYIEYKKTGELQGIFRIPFVVGRKILKEGNIKRNFSYLTKLQSERRRIYLISRSWQLSPIGKYAKTDIRRQIYKVKNAIGKDIKAHLYSIKKDLVDLFEQLDLIKYEMINGKKDFMRKKIMSSHATINQNIERNFYIQNGYEYWPFKGEYWVDEVGNYHYLGLSSCNQ